MRKIRIPYQVNTQVMSMKSRASSVKQWLGASAFVMAGLALNPLYTAMAAEAPQQQVGALFRFQPASQTAAPGAQ
jgi:iron complex outermembrane recepter protein